MPLIRRLPKRGFNNARHTVAYLPVNVGLLNRFEEGAQVDPEVLRGAGLAQGAGDGVKILGGGDLSRKLVIRAHAFSATARQKIEQAGGTCEVIGKSPGA